MKRVHLIGATGLCKWAVATRALEETSNVWINLAALAAGCSQTSVLYACLKGHSSAGVCCRDTVKGLGRGRWWVRPCQGRKGSD